MWRKACLVLRKMFHLPTETNPLCCHLINGSTCFNIESYAIFQSGITREYHNVLYSIFAICCQSRDQTLTKLTCIQIMIFVANKVLHQQSVLLNTTLNFIDFSQINFPASIFPLI